MKRKPKLILNDDMKITRHILIMHARQTNNTDNFLTGQETKSVCKVYVENLHL